ncbi:DUF4249 domain-containing protein [Hymenobacter arizonensis]|uniref:DUF4249 domain-containing protein n=1 Tax=Hymenobacter arizonensis TaxID=1227077 RepID=A0A1I5X6K8_HYMAR|nr:DUF4249 domain-containing protein [Hymenobacter arizonensis]SFQ27635.1 protein of unknown function [Hymenobacter arizonensis]
MRTISASSFWPQWVLLGSLLALLAGCTDPYLPEATSSPPNYLVVDGFLNSEGVTTIRLSRTYAIASKTAPPAETRATVYIEDEAGARFMLFETVAGTYISTALVLNTARKYRLHLNTAGGKEYVSEYVPVKTTPPIDDVRWRTTNAGLDVLVDTHDDANATQYYRWEYDETWEITPPYRPVVEYVGGMMRSIAVPYPLLCWSNARSTTVLIDKTTALTRDVVANFRVRQLLTTSNLLNTRYSVLVQQHALTKEEYAYWELLRRNTESIGSLFDPQPAQLTGNVRSLTSETDLALGYVGAHSLTEKRIFISRRELPRTWPVQTGYESCIPPDSVFIDRPNPPPPNPARILQDAFTNKDYLPIEGINNRISILIGYTAQSRDCIDCRTRGTTVKPSFW